jgi:predicted amidohydrolase
MKPFTIAGVSFWPELWKPEKNLRLLLTHVRQAAGMGARVIASPEGILDGYISRDLEKHKIREKDRPTKGFARRLARFKARQLALADRIKGQCIPRVQAEAAKLGVYLFVNSLDRRRGKSVFNTTFVIDPAGKIVGKYDKIHAGFEMVNALGKGHRVFPTPYAPIGVLICADRQYPEAPRSVALAGARVLIINSYGMWGEGANERFIRQRAYENGLFVLFCHPGESVLVSPEGRIIAATCAWEHVVARAIDPSQAVGRGCFGSRRMAATYLARPDHPAYAERYREKQRKKAK